MIDLFNKVIEYQKVNGTESNPQIIMFKLAGCKKCKEVQVDLMINDADYDEFDCMNEKHEEIADEIETVLNINHYPILFITRPQYKIITTDDLKSEHSVYEQIQKYL
jgi:glutaredoxin